MKKMSSKIAAVLLTLLALFFYFGIFSYISFVIIGADTFMNFGVGMVFVIISFLILGFLLLSNIIFKPIKTGYFVPLVIVAITYLLLTDILFMVGVATMETAVFVLINMILLFIYSVVTIPMYIMGKR